jgi:hypothetical protein
MRAIVLAAVGLWLVNGWTALAQKQGQGSDQQQQTQDSKKKKGAKAGTASKAPAAHNTPPPPPPPPPPKPKPLFGGSLTLKSSRQSKDATTLGFNGLDPNGQVQKAVLDANPTPQDTATAQQLAASQVNPAQLDSFIKSGNLSETAPPKEAPKGKK